MNQNNDKAGVYHNFVYVLLFTIPLDLKTMVIVHPIDYY